MGKFWNIHFQGSILRKLKLLIDKELNSDLKEK